MTLPASHVLLVEDDPAMPEILAALLQDDQITVSSASSAAQALTVTREKHPDLILLDLGLPDISGVEFLRRLREWNQTPVLVLSVIGDDETKAAALDTGADDYLTKPFSPLELLARIRVLERRAQPR